MTRISICLCAVLLLICCALPMSAQQAATTATTTVVPPIMKYSGTLTDAKGAPIASTVGVTFALYQNEQGGSALWLETQNVTPDKAGHYTVTLGSTTGQGLPANLFANGEARWLAVQVQGEAERTRALLMSVPYAMKAVDAETVGGKPASSFMLTPQAGGKSAAPGKLPPGTITGSGTADFIPRFTGTTTIGNSNIFETVGGNVGIATTTPAAKLDVKGTGDIRDTLTLFHNGLHPVLSVNGTAFKVSSTGLVTFVSGQTFPGTGTVTSVGTGQGLTGGPITHSGTISIPNGGVTNTLLAFSSVTVNAGTDLTGGGAVALGSSTTLNLDTTKVPTLAASNSFTGATNAFSGNVSAANLSTGGTVSGVTGSFSGDVFANEFSASTSSSDAVSAVSTGALGVYGESDFDSFHFAAIDAWNFGSTQETFGVYGYTASAIGAGAYGESVSASTLGSGIFPNAGVWGDTGNTGNDGVLGTADDAFPLVAFNNSPNGRTTLFVENQDTTNSANPVFRALGSGFGGECDINEAGDLSCTGSKSAVVPVDNATRKVALYAVEAPENWFEDFGSGTLAGGAATVALEPTFAQTVNTATEYHVFLTPKGDCKGLYVANETPAGFEVHELGGGQSNVAFDYRIVARRKGYENIRLADKTKMSQYPTPDSVRKERATKPPVPVKRTRSTSTKLGANVQPAAAHK